MQSAPRMRPRLLGLGLMTLARSATAQPQDADFSWQSGSPRTHDSPLASKYFTGELRIDDSFNYSFNHPADDTIAGSTEAWRSGENQLTQLGVGGDFHIDNVMARMMT